MKRILNVNRYFVVPYLVFLLISIVTIIFVSKAQIHIELNKLNSPFLDQFFKRVTLLGNGIFYLLLLIVLLLYSYRWSIAFVASVAISNLMVFIGKQILFKEALRPTLYFEIYGNYKLHLVEGVKLHTLDSFPSGHATTAFTLFIMLAFVVRNNTLKFLCFVLALLIGYSRIYLSQHFLVDVVAGSVIGVISVLLMWYLSKKWELSWMDKSLLSGIKTPKIGLQLKWDRLS